MASSEVCAVVVTYYPDADVIKNLRLLAAQLPHIVVVDNGSPAAALSPVREACQGTQFQWIENIENLGIATALNQGVRAAQQIGFNWVLLFDQDSSITDDYVTRMLHCFDQSQHLAILVPRYVDQRFGTVLAPPVSSSGTLEAATTSGSLMPVAIFTEAGMFADELFIDGVDYEYSLRVRRLGYIIAECTDAVLLHSPGTPTHHRVFGGKPFQVANYSPIRRYYQERNKIWVTRRYWRDFAGFCARQFLTSSKDLLKIILVEEDKVKKLRFFFRGLLDGLRGRTGKKLA